MDRLTPLMSSVSGDWQTPEKILQLVRDFGSIGLDPCTDTSNPTRACNYFSSLGLEHSWRGYGLVYVNPPYGRFINSWVSKTVEEHRKNSVEIIMLLPSRTDARWWQDNVVYASSICFWRGRLKFVGAGGIGALLAAPFPSAIWYFGDSVDRFVKVFGPYGWIP